MPVIGAQIKNQKAQINKNQLLHILKLQNICKSSKIGIQYSFNFIITFFIFNLINLTFCFEFSAPSVTVNPLIINTLSTYDFIIDRSYTQDLIQTNWSIQLVPAGSNITIYFPKQYNLTSLPRIQNIEINNVNISSFQLFLQNSTNLIIKNAIPISLAISSVIIQLSNVLNPSPALSTSTFLIDIGKDKSSLIGSANSIITLLPDTFQTSKIIFDPPYTNSSGTMILTINPKNNIPSNGTLQIIFSSLQWIQEVSSNNQLNLDKVNLCSVVSKQISKVTCLGSNSLKKITISLFLNSNTNYVENSFQLSIHSLFSPPSTSPPDIVKISSYTNLGYQLDTINTVISQLKPQNISLIIQPGTTPLYINTWTLLNFKFTNIDTILKNDYFQIAFPQFSTISYQRSTSSFNLTNITFNSNTLTLRFYQITNSMNTNLNTLNYIRFLNYKSGLTAKETQKIYLIVYSSLGGKKMQGYSSIKAQAINYSIIIQQSDNFQINQVTNYYLTFNLTNQLSNKAMIKIILPNQLSLILLNNGSLPKCPALNTSLNNNLICTLYNNSTKIIYLKNIWTNIPSFGVHRISILNLKNPGHVTNISKFEIILYYNQSQDTQVAFYSSNFSLKSNILTTIAKKINQEKIFINLSNYKVFTSNVTYNISFQINNSIPENGFIQISFPINVNSFKNIINPSTNFKCIFTYQEKEYNISLCKYNITSQKVNIYLDSSFKIQINGNTILVKVTLFQCCSNLYNTKSISLLNISSSTSVNQLIEYMQSQYQISGFVHNQFKKFNAIKNSQKNNQLCIWSFNWTSYQQIDELNSIITINFTWPALVSSKKFILYTFISPNSSLSQFQLTNYSLSQNKKVLTFIIPESFLNYISYNLTISFLKNPLYSLESIYASIQIKTSDNYLYSESNFTLPSTTLPSSFQTLKYNFSSKLLDSFTSLKLDIKHFIQYQGKINKFSLSKLKQYHNYLNKNQTINIKCKNQTELGLNCSLSKDYDNLQIKYQNSSSFFINQINLEIQNLYVNASLVYQNLTIKSFYLNIVNNNYLLASSDSSIEFIKICKMPCKQCIGENYPNNIKCTSCYDQNIYVQVLSQAGIYLYHQNCYKNCPHGTYQYNFTSNNLINISYPYICQPCSLKCLTCSKEQSNCTSCNLSSVYKYFYNQSCIQKCPNITYPNQTLQSFYICNSCKTPCFTCVQQLICTSCVQKYYLYNNKCREYCPQNLTIANNQLNICEDCAKECKVCQNLTTFCLSCSINPLNNKTYLFIYDENKCVQTCPQGRVINKNEDQCVLCLDPCKTCSIIENNCTSCNLGTFYSMIQKNKCITKCETFYFGNSTTNQCQLCNSSSFNINCKNCKSQLKCKQCDKFSGYVFFPKNQTCLIKVPSGYVNQSGIAVQCNPICSECIGFTDNCSKCGNNNFLLNQECLTNCPSKYVGIDGVCFQCIKNCYQCSFSTSNCTKCYNLYYFYQKTNQTIQNQCVLLCPPNYFQSSYELQLADKKCIKCEDPCLDCVNKTICESCLNNKYLYEGLCFTKCPNGTIPNKYSVSSNSSLLIIKKCLNCNHPCLNCLNQTFNCISCNQGYYLFKPYMRCYQPNQCPINISIQNSSLGECETCLQPCFKCVNSTIKCLSCIYDYYLIPFNNTCTKICPNGYYKGISQCLLCKNKCQTCENQTYCYTCQTSYYFYKNKCLKNCPVTHSIIINQQCTLCKRYCLNCNSSNFCFDCESHSILYQGQCLSECPYVNSKQLYLYYNKTNNKKQCLTAQQYGTKKLSQNLISSLNFLQILPFPFLIISILILLFGIISKIQNQNTYFLGLIYVIFGLAEIGSLLFLWVKFFIVNNYELGYSQLIEEKMLYGCLILIGILNFLSLTCGSVYMSQDRVFAKWMGLIKNDGQNQSDSSKKKYNKDKINIFNHHKNNESFQNIFQPSHKQRLQAQTAQELSKQSSQSSEEELDSICCQNSTSFILITLLSLITTYKLKLILFTNFFNFSFFSAKFDDVQKFRMFNIMSLIGLAHQGVTIYVIWKFLKKIGNLQINNQECLILIDCLIVTLISALIGIIIMRKNDNFFKKEKQNSKKYVKNKQILKNNQKLQSKINKQQRIKNNQFDTNNFKKLKTNNKISNIYNNFNDTRTFRGQQSNQRFFNLSDKMQSKRNNQKQGFLNKKQNKIKKQNNQIGMITTSRRHNYEIKQEKRQIYQQKQFQSPMKFLKIKQQKNQLNQNQINQYQTKHHKIYSKGKIKKNKRKMLNHNIIKPQSQQKIQQKEIKNMEKVNQNKKQYIKKISDIIQNKDKQYVNQIKKKNISNEKIENRIKNQYSSNKQMKKISLKNRIDLFNPNNYPTIQQINQNQKQISQISQKISEKQKGKEQKQSKQVFKKAEQVLNISQNKKNIKSNYSAQNCLDCQILQIQEYQNQSNIKQTRILPFIHDEQTKQFKYINKQQNQYNQGKIKQIKAQNNHKNRINKEQFQFNKKRNKSLNQNKQNNKNIFQMQSQYEQQEKQL